MALITTAFAFITGAFSPTHPTCGPPLFGLDAVQGQELFGAGIWPFAISIILFSLIIDRVGYKTAMIFSFVCYAAYAGLAFMAHGIVTGAEGEALAGAQKQAYNFLYAGSIILGLGNGTVEAFINPVVATMFHKKKPSGSIFCMQVGRDGHGPRRIGWIHGWFIRLENWRILIYLIPTLVFWIMFLLPKNERVCGCWKVSVLRNV